MAEETEESTYEEEKDAVALYNKTIDAFHKHCVGTSKDADRFELIAFFVAVAWIATIVYVSGNGKNTTAAIILLGGWLVSKVISLAISRWLANNALNQISQAYDSHGSKWTEEAARLEKKTETTVWSMEFLDVVATTYLVVSLILLIVRTVSLLP